MPSVVGAGNASYGRRKECLNSYCPMNRRDFAKRAAVGSAALAASAYTRALAGAPSPLEAETPGFEPLFNGKNLDGFVNVTTTDDTWRVEDGLLICSGHPTGVMRTAKQYENFILDIEWRHMEAGGNSGVFVWADGTPYEDKPFPTGIEVQMLDPGWAEINKRPVEYAHGHLFPVMGLEGTTPDHPSEVASGRSASVENRVKGTGQWNRYVLVAVDGTLKLAVNGKFVNGIRSANRKKGYICPESEGAEIHFRKIDIMELPGSVITPDQMPPVVG